MIIKTKLFCLFLLVVRGLYSLPEILWALLPIVQAVQSQIFHSFFITQGYNVTTFFYKLQSNLLFAHLDTSFKFFLNNIIKNDDDNINNLLFLHYCYTNY